MILTDKQLLTTSLCISALGLLGLFLIFSFSELPITSIQNAESFLDGDDVRIEGRIISSDIRGNTTFLVIEQSCTIDAIVFDKVELKEDSLVSISGTMDTYKDRREVLIEEISVLH